MVSNPQGRSSAQEAHAFGHGRRVLACSLGLTLTLTFAFALDPKPLWADSEPMTVEAINSRVHQGLAAGAASGGTEAGKFETISGQIYLSEKDIDADLVSQALDALLRAEQVPEERVAIRQAPRLNFEIHFKKNTADLTTDSCRGLDELGRVLQREHLHARFILGGHTDLDGDAEVNNPLSRARAESARDYLVERYGIAPERLEARGYGMSEPLHRVERSLQDKQINRRVDLRLVRD